MVKTKSPKYCCQKQPNRLPRAFVLLDGRRHYLGEHGTPESLQAYHRALAEWNAAGQRSEVARCQITVMEVLAHFWKHCETYYRRLDGTQTSEVENFRQAIRPLKQLYGLTKAIDFGPKALKAVRERMIEVNWCRRNVNTQINRIKHVFKWAVAQELVPPSVHQGLVCVEALKSGRCEARESEPVRPVADPVIEAVKPFVSRQVWALIQMQRLTGARAGELVRLRAVDIDANGDIWSYSPLSHKNAHHGHRRTIFFGPQAQQVLRPFMAERAIHAFLFSPLEAQRERAAQTDVHRRPSQKPTRRKTDRAVGACYTVESYRRAIARACDEAFPHPDEKLRRRYCENGGLETRRSLWARLTEQQRAELRAWQSQNRWNPHQLRHTAATSIRKLFGIEAAQVMLGHSRLDTTELYAERNMSHAVEIATRAG
ncbi:MAG: site-specific integrase [Phycisphaerales bacterium]|nr:site-specific integrase [Phycisphaerales bacterium]